MFKLKNILNVEDCKECSSGINFSLEDGDSVIRNAKVSFEETCH